VSVPSTHSRTVADLLPGAAALFGERPAIRHRRGEGEWSDISFAELERRAEEVGRGLIALGVEPGERVCVLANTRPEWTIADFGVCMSGAVVVPIYPTSSAEECAWVIGDSKARTVICEGPEQVAKVEAVRDGLPALREVVAIDPGAGDLSLEQLRRRGEPVAREALAERTAAVAGEDLYTIIYTSGSTGPPKGCVHTHRSYRAAIDSVTAREVLRGAEDLVYLFLPLAHSFALIVQLAALDSGTTVAYSGGDPQRILAELVECRPTFLPSVPRIFEKVYRAVGAEGRGERPDEALAARVGAVFGGRLREASSGGAPIAREVLEFFWECGIPVMEGYGLTETGTAVTVSRPDAHRFGTVGRAVPGIEIRIAADGEVMLRGESIFTGYHGNPEATSMALVDGWLATGDLGSIDADGYLTIAGRKKDIIITAGGKNIAPANLENDMRQSRWVSQAVMHGDRRPYPVLMVTLDRDEVLAWASAEGFEDTSPSALAADERVRALVRADLDRANARYARSEQAKRFFILDRELSAERGELTPSLKVRRAEVDRLHSARFEALYRER
jgi:long-chain acyl-CoA synthetase